MKSDRELLELAARAAGIELFFWSDKQAIKGTTVEWNPLTDDADAFRLAVKLKLLIDTCSPSSRGGRSEVGDGETYADELHMTDPYAATRRAIVRASAKIGEGK